MDTTPAPFPTSPLPAPHGALDLASLRVPPWLGELAESLMHTAEDMFGPKTGADKKAWVRNALVDALGRVDVKAIPNWIETPAKGALVDLFIEIIWSIHWGAEKRRQARLFRRTKRARALFDAGQPVPHRLAGLVPTQAAVAFDDDDVDDGDLPDDDTQGE